MKRTVLFVGLILLAEAATAQGPGAVKVKDTPASQELIQLAKTELSDRSAANAELDKARADLNESTKSINAQIQAAQKDLQEKLKEDKRYKPLLDNIDALQKQLADASQKAEAKFQKEVQPLASDESSIADEISALVKVVRQENSFPPTAQFSIETQEWTLPVSDPKPPTKK